MNFHDAEIFLNQTLLFGRPSLIVVGANGIGKTEMVRQVSNVFRKRCRYVAPIDYGGLVEASKQMLNMKEDMIVIPDLKDIIMRKSGVRAATIGYISALISDGVVNSMTFNRELTPYEKNMKSKRINFIIPGTSMHIKEIVLMKEYDFLNRFVFLEVERGNEEFMEEGFKLEAPMLKKVDREAFRKYKFEKFNVSPRFNETLNFMLRGFSAMGIDGKAFLVKSPPKVFDPKDFVGSVTLNDILKPMDLTVIGGRENDKTKEV